MKNNETNDNQIKAQNKTIQYYEKRIVSILVDDETECLSFLPYYLDDLCVRLEDKIYYLMGCFCRNYSGDYWSYYKLAKIDCDKFEGFYMAPSEGKYKFACRLNGFSGELSADAAGVVVVTLYALNWLIEEIYDRRGYADKRLKRLYNFYYALRDFAAQHTECELIFRAID